MSVLKKVELLVYEHIFPPPPCGQVSPCDLSGHGSDQIISVIMSINVIKKRNMIKFLRIILTSLKWFGRSSEFEISLIRNAGM